MSAFDARFFSAGENRDPRPGISLPDSPIVNGSPR